jgi:hypothetical protein
MALERQSPPETDPLPLPEASPPPPPQRNPRIHLFAGADPCATASAEEPAPKAGDAEQPIISSTGDPQICP